MSLSPIVMLMLLRYRDALAFETFRLNVVVAVLLDEFISSISREKEAEKQIEEKEQQKRRITGVQLSFFVLFSVLLLPFCLSFSSFCLFFTETPHHGSWLVMVFIDTLYPQGETAGGAPTFVHADNSVYCSFLETTRTICLCTAPYLYPMTQNLDKPKP